MSLNPTDVVLTGLGPVTSIGAGNDALWTSISQRRSLTTRRVIPVDLGRTIELAIASMPGDDRVPGLERHSRFLVEQDCSGYRDVAYSLLAIELALNDAGVEYDRSDNKIGVMQAFEAPGAEQTVARLFGMFSTPPPTPGPPLVYDTLSSFFYTMQPFVYVHLIGKAFGFHGLSTGVHNACASGAVAIEAAAQHIRSGQSDTMIVVGGEAFDTGVRLEWFRRLDLYVPDDRMKPFDSTASGFFVGEGAAAIVLESAASAEQRGATPYAVYRGGAFAQQGWKQVIPDVRAQRLSQVITNAMTSAGVTAGDIDLIVPHGAATQLSDGYEASCLADALKGQRENAVATAFKPYVGHMLAASGIIETICTLLCMKHQTVAATLHTSPDNVQLPIPLITTATERPVRTVLKLSTGFTGHDSAIVFQQPDA